ncbi:MAG: hypothetical protein WCL27_18590, partial [Betaproteobacteria bacterium]
RRWGGIVSGLLIGLPLTSAPISFILAYEFGTEFASQAAVGNLAGQISNCFFCLAYIFVAKKCNWLISSFAAIAAFLAMTLALNSMVWQLWPAFIVLLVTLVLVALLIPRQATSLKIFSAPRWDLPGRIIAATSFVILLTTLADQLGAQLSGLISPFPVFSVVFAAFTHSQSGAKAASNLLRGVVLGSGAYATFFLIVGALLTQWGITLTYVLATLLALAISGLSFLITRIKKTGA